MGRPPKYGSKREARLNIALKPEMKEALEKMASIDSISVNRLVEIVLQRYINDRIPDIKKYDQRYAKFSRGLIAHFV